MGTGAQIGRLLLVACIVSAGAVGAAGSAGATTSTARWASPTGVASAACPKSAPCDIVTAINDAPAKSEVVVEPGTYGAPTALTTTLVDTNGDLDIHGLAGKPAPLIVSVGSGTFGGFFITHGSHLSDLRVDYSGTPSSQYGVAVYLNSGSADHLAVLATTGFGNIACDVTTSLTDSTCVDTAPNGDAVSPTALGDINLVLKGVTAEATGIGAAGIDLGGTPAPHLYVTVTNSIIHGAAADLAEATPQSGQLERITIAHSDYKTAYPTSPGTGESFVVGVGNVSAAPKFVNAAGRNFAERPTSPTVNNGAADSGHDTDLAGNPRTLGSAPDMGAYELPQRATVAKPKVSRKKSTSATLTVSANPEGLATTIRFFAVHGHDTISSATAKAGAGLTSRSVRLVVHGLRKHTKYSIYAVAKNSAGTTKSAKVTVTTPKH
jgi:hypothetical protein